MILYLISCISFTYTFLLHVGNTKNDIERDIANQLWVQIFQRLFYIHDSIGHIKVLETALARCTITESRLYNDIRTLLDYQDEEFDLMSREACLPDVGVSKLENDDSKLLKFFYKKSQHLLYNFF